MGASFGSIQSCQAEFCAFVGTCIWQAATPNTKTLGSNFLGRVLIFCGLQSAERPWATSEVAVPKKMNFRMAYTKIQPMIMTRKLASVSMERRGGGGSVPMIMLT